MVGEKVVVVVGLVMDVSMSEGVETNGAEDRRKTKNHVTQNKIGGWQ